MEFVRERLPRYNDENVFNDFINNGYYEIINYSELGNKFVLKKNIKEKVCTLQDRMQLN